MLELEKRKQSSVIKNQLPRPNVINQKHYKAVIENDKSDEV